MLRKESYTVEDIAKLTNSDTETVRRWLRSGKLKGRRVVRKYIITNDALRDFIGEAMFNGLIDDNPEPAKSAEAYHGESQDASYGEPPEAAQGESQDASQAESEQAGTSSDTEGEDYTMKDYKSKVLKQVKSGISIDKAMTGLLDDLYKDKHNDLIPELTAKKEIANIAELLEEGSSAKYVLFFDTRLRLEEREDFPPRPEPT